MIDRYCSRHGKTFFIEKVMNHRIAEVCLECERQAYIERRAPYLTPVPARTEFRPNPQAPPPEPPSLAWRLVGAIFAGLCAGAFVAALIRAALGIEDLSALMFSYIPTVLAVAMLTFNKSGKARPVPPGAYVYNPGKSRQALAEEEFRTEYLPAEERTTLAFRLTQEQQRQERYAKLGIGHLDRMTGVEFEEYMANHFRRRGYIVEKTPSSNDHGVDVLIRDRAGKTTAVQCKRYDVNSKISNDAVQQVFSGMHIYKADTALLVTTTYLTSHALDAARKLSVDVWDRDRLVDEIGKIAALDG